MKHKKLIKKHIGQLKSVKEEIEEEINKNKSDNKCYWENDGFTGYKTGCRNYVGGSSRKKGDEGAFNYCPYCGKVISYSDDFLNTYLSTIEETLKYLYRGLSNGGKNESK